MDKLFSDEQLIAFFVCGNVDAWNIFFEIYHIHSIKEASEATKFYKGSGVSYEEFYSLALECITLALNGYQLYSCTFYSYWKKVVEAKFNTYVRSNSFYAKSKLDMIAMSLDENAFEESKTKYEDILGVRDSIMSSRIENKELFEYIFSKIKLLNQKERQFLLLLIDGYDVIEIEHIMDLRSKDYYRIRKSIQKKLDIELIKEYFN